MLFLSSCLTATKKANPTYYKAVLKSSLDNNYSFNIRASRRNCKKIKNKKGQFIYPSTCGGYSNRHYKRLSTALVSVYSASKKYVVTRDYPFIRVISKARNLQELRPLIVAADLMGLAKRMGRLMVLVARMAHHMELIHMVSLWI